MYPLLVVRSPVYYSKSSVQELTEPVFLTATVNKEWENFRLIEWQLRLFLGNPWKDNLRHTAQSCTLKVSNYAIYLPTLSGYRIPSPMGGVLTAVL